MPPLALVPGSSSKATDALKKQVSSLMTEKDELAAELEDLDKQYGEARKAASDAKKACKAHLAELEQLETQLADLSAAGTRGLRRASALAASA